MFKDLRPNNPFYVLQRNPNQKPVLNTGAVIGVSQPVSKTSMTAFGQADMVVDVKVKIGNETCNFEKLPANLDIADSNFANSTNMVVSCSKDLIKNEIESMHSQSKSVIESASYHEMVMQECEKILFDLNPAFANEKKQEEKIQQLTNELADMKRQLGGLDDIKQMLAGLVPAQQAQGGSNNNNKKQ